MSKLPREYRPIVTKIQKTFYDTIRSKYLRVMKMETEHGLVYLDNDYDESCLFRFNGIDFVDDDYDFKEFNYPISEITVSFSYQFGHGHTTKRNKDGSKHVPYWSSPFKKSLMSEQDGDGDKWSEHIIELLTNFNTEFPFVDVDSDSDFGYQNFRIILSKNKRVIDYGSSEGSSKSEE